MNININIILMKKIKEDVNKNAMKIMDLLGMMEKSALHLVMVHKIVALLILI